MRPSAWRRFLTWFRAVEEAMDISHDDIQDQRIVALEREVAHMRRAIETARVITEVDRTSVGDRLAAGPRDDRDPAPGAG